MRIAFLDRDRAIAELTECTQALLERDPRVQAVGLFGSLARGEALPSSDADLLLVLKTHSQPRWFDRLPEYAAAFQCTALPAEPFPYTWEELTRMLSQPGLIRTAVREAILLGGDPQVWERLRRLLQQAESG